MEATQILMKEHEIIKSIIRNSVEKISTTTISLNDFNEYFEFFAEYADTFHHMKEEKIYFNWILAKDPNLKHGPVGMMLSEHEVLRNVLKQARTYLEQNQYDEFKNAYFQFCNTLYNHINKEDSVLYKLAEKIDANFHDGDMSMLSDFNLVQKNQEKIVSRWSNYPIHEEVQLETKQLNSNQGHAGGCCGMC
jgi:hemerythrin-like domain-containing protein